MAGGFELKFEIPTPTPELSIRGDWSDDLVDGGARMVTRAMDGSAP